MLIPKYWNGSVNVGDFVTREASRSPAEITLGTDEERFLCPPPTASIVELFLDSPPPLNSDSLFSEQLIFNTTLSNLNPNSSSSLVKAEVAFLVSSSLKSSDAAASPPPEKE